MTILATVSGLFVSSPSKNWIRTLLKFLVINVLLLIPLSAFAHIISITVNSPFPAQMNLSSTASATYTVKNISSRVPVDCDRSKSIS
jgi:hypothetical protein